MRCESPPQPCQPAGPSALRKAVSTPHPLLLPTLPKRSPTKTLPTPAPHLSTHIQVILTLGPGPLRPNPSSGLQRLVLHQFPHKEQCFYIPALVIRLPWFNSSPPSASLSHQVLLLRSQTSSRVVPHPSLGTTGPFLP